MWSEIDPEEPDLADDAMIGTLVGDRYLIQGVIGRGGMGVVYEGTHKDLGRPVAIKVLSPAWSSDRSAVARFFREARTASAMGHPNVVDVYDLGYLPDGRPYLAMPRLDGVDLARLLATCGPQSPGRVAELLKGVASALDAMHARGLVHRDIKPENLVLVRLPDDTEMVQVLDFGLAALYSLSAPRLTRQGMINGTPHYLPPEAARGELADARGDVYSLAVVAFELMTGAPPIDGSSVFDIINTKLSSEPPTLSERAGHPFPPEVEAVIRRGLAIEPRDRYPKASLLVRALAQAARPTAPRPQQRQTEEVSWLEAASAEAAACSEHDEPLEPPERAEPAPQASTFAGAPRRRRVLLLATLAVVVAGASAGIGAVMLSAASGDGQGPSARLPEHEPILRPAPSGEEPAAARPGAPTTDAGADQPEAGPRADALAGDVADLTPMERPRTKALTPTPSGGARRQPGPDAAPEPPPEPRSVAAPGPGPAPEPARADDASARDQAAALTREAGAAMIGGMVPRSISLYRQAIAIAPGYGPAWRGLGVAHERLGQGFEAADAYRHYLRLAPNARDAATIRERLERLGGE